MPIDARIPLATEGGGFTAFDPSQLIGQAERIRAMRSRTNRQDFITGQEQQQAQRQEQRRAAFVFDETTGKVDEDATRQNLAKVGDFEAIAAIDTAKAKAQKTRLENEGKGLENQKKRIEVFTAEQEAAADEVKAKARWLSTVKDDASLRIALAGMAAEGRIPQAEADNPPPLTDELKAALNQFVEGSRRLEDRRKEAAAAAKQKATGKNQSLVNAERKRHNVALERIAKRRGDQAESRQKETERHNRRMEKLTGSKATGDDPVARRQREQENRRQANELDKEEQRLDRAQTAIGQQLETPDGDDFVTIGKGGAAIEQEMTAEIRKALENRQKANEREVLAVARRKAQKVFGNDLKKITPQDLQAYARSRGISIAEAERKALADGFMVE